MVRRIFIGIMLWALLPVMTMAQRIQQQNARSTRRYVFLAVGTIYEDY